MSRTKHSGALLLLVLLFCLSGAFTAAMATFPWSTTVYSDYHAMIPSDGPVSVYFQGLTWDDATQSYPPHPMNTAVTADAFVVYKVDPNQYYSSISEIPATSIVPRGNYVVNWSANASVATLVFTTPLENSKTSDPYDFNNVSKYGIMLSSSALDAEGLTTADTTYSQWVSEFTVSFSGMMPHVNLQNNGSYPFYRSEAYGSTVEYLEVYFNAPMDHASVEQNFWCEVMDGSEIKGWFEWPIDNSYPAYNDKKVIFHPFAGMFPVGPDGSGHFIEWGINGGAHRLGRTDLGLWGFDSEFATGTLKFDKFDSGVSSINVFSEVGLRFEVEGRKYDLTGNITSARVYGPNLPTEGVSLEITSDFLKPRLEAKVFGLPQPPAINDLFTFQFDLAYADYETGATFEVRQIRLKSIYNGFASNLTPANQVSVDPTGITFEWDSADLPPLEFQKIQLVNSQGMLFWETHIPGDYRIPWEEEPYPSTQQIADIWAANDEFVFACGANGLFSKHEYDMDMVLPAMTTWDLNAVHGIATNEVWAVGDSGTVLRYDGATVTDLSISALDGYDLQGVVVLSATDVWMVGSNMSIIHYDGTTFTPVIVDGGGDQSKKLNVIKADETGTLYAAGTGGVFYTYSGGTWSAPQNTGFAIDIRDIWGFSNGVQWAVGASATGTAMAVRYLPPLMQWQEVPTTSAYPINTIWGFEANDVYLGDDGGFVTHWDGTALTYLDHTGIGTGNIQSCWGFAVDEIVFVGGVLGQNSMVLSYNGPHKIVHYKQRYFGQDLAPDTYEWRVVSGTPDDSVTVTTAQFVVNGVNMFSHYPDNLAVNVPLNQEINLYFSAPMDRNSVENAFRVLPLDGAAAPMPLYGNFSWYWDESLQEENMAWVPTSPLPIGMTIEVTLGLPEATAFDYRGYPVQNQPIQFVFRTLNAASANGPILTSHIPGNGNPNIPVDTNIVMYFSADIDVASLASGIEVNYTTPEITTPVVCSGNWSYDQASMAATFAFDSLPLPYDALVTVTATGITGLAPDLFPVVNQPYSFHFITRKPASEIVYHWPEAGMPVSTMEHVSIGFTGNVDITMVEAGFSLTMTDSTSTAPIYVPGTFEWQTDGSTFFNYIPSYPLVEGAVYTAFLMGPINDIYGNPINMDPAGYSFTFVVSQTSARLFGVNPYNVKTGGTWVVSVYGANLMTPEFHVLPEYGSGVNASVVSVNGDFTGASVELTVDSDTWVGTRDLMVTNGEGSMFTLNGAFNVEREAYMAYASTLTLQNPADPSSKLYGLFLNMEMDWSVTYDVTSILVTGPNLPPNGITLEQSHQTASMPSWTKKFVFEPGIINGKADEFIFTVNPESANPITRTVTAMGFFESFATDLAPAAGATVEDFASYDFFSWNHPLATDSTTTPTYEPNLFGMANCIIRFIPDSTTATGITVETIQGTQSPFAVRLDPGVNYNVTVDTNHDGITDYAISNLLLPGGQEPAAYINLPAGISQSTPLELCIIPDRTLPDTQGGIQNIMAIVPGVDLLNLTVLEANYQAGQTISDSGLTPLQVSVFDSSQNQVIFGNPYMMAVNSISGFPNPTMTTTPVGPMAESVIQGFAVMVDKLENVNGQEFSETIWFNYYDYEWMYRDQTTGKFTSSYYGPALYPGTYRWWVLTEDANGNLSGASETFVVPSFAGYATIPVDGALAVDGAAPITISFTTTMDTYSFDNTFMVVPEGSNQPVQGYGSWTIETDAVSGLQYSVYNWTPSVPLSPGLLHHVSAGRPDWPLYTDTWKPVAPIHFAYTTAQQEGIYVTSTYPSNFDTNVPENTVISIAFSSDMEATSTIAATSLSYSDATSTTLMPVAINVNVVGSQINIFPFSNGVQQPLNTGTAYQLVIGPTAAAADGTVFGKSFVLNFTTYDPNSYVITPYVVDTVPKYGALNVPVTGKFSVTFSEPMTILSVASGITSNPPIQGNLETPTSLNPSSFTFAPSANLAANTKYTITISQSVKNAAGVAMGYPYVIEFTTGSSTLTADDPIVEGTVPMNSATEVPEYSSVYIHFNKFMNHTATEGAITISPAVAYSASWNTPADETYGETLFITPTAPFAYSTRYKITVGAAAADTAGKTIPAAYSFEFTTAANYNTTLTPAVSFNSPGNGDTYVPTASPINIVFNKTMNTSSVEAVTSVTRTDVTPAVAIPGSFAWYSEAMQFTPQVPFPAGATIQVTVGKAAADSYQLTLGADFIFSFQTASETGTGTQAPKVLATVPVDGATAVPTSAYITVAFDSPMDHLSTQNAIRFTPALAGTWMWAGNTATLQPAAALTTNTTYSVSVGTGALNSDGVALAAAREFKFTTASTGSTNPVVVATVPSTGMYSIPLNTTIDIAFSKDMDHSATESAISITPALSGKSFLWSSTGVTIVPTANLTAGTKYTVYVSTAAKDVNGNSLGAAYSFNFTTSSTAAPTVVSTIPGNGAVSVPLNSSVSITFSDDMRPLITQQSIVMVPTIEGYWAWNGKTALFSPIAGASLMPDTFYTITVASTAVNTSNVPMSTPFTFAFSTVAATATTKPMVQGVTPPPGIFGVSSSSKVSINFDRSMNPVATEPAFSLAREVQADAANFTYEPVTGTFAWYNDNSTLIFTPTQPLIAGSFYQVSVSETALSSSGEALMPWMSFFQTMYDTTTTNFPFVTMTMPTSGTTNVPVDAYYTMAFSQSMNTASVESAISSVPAVTNPVFTWYDNNTRVEIKPGEKLALNQLYTLSIPANTATSADGGFLTAFSSTFTTMASDSSSSVVVLATLPGANATNVPLSAKINITFSGPMNPDKTQNAVTVTDGAGSPVTGATFSWPENFHLVITPPSTIKANTSYTVTVANTAESAAGVALGAPYTFNFTTIDTSGSVVITGTKPGAGATAVATTSSVEITFSKEMTKLLAETAFSITPYMTGSTQWTKLTDTSGATTGHVMKFTPINGFAKGTLYTVRVGTAAKALDATSLPAEYLFNFTTAYQSTDDVKVISTAPFDGMEGVPVDVPVVVFFNAAMDTAATQAAVTFTPTVAGLGFEWSTDGYRLKITHANFTAGTQYVMNLSNSGRSAAGTALTPYRLSFTSYASSAGVAPTVVSTMPANNSTGFGAYDRIMVNFSQLMAGDEVASDQITISPATGGFFAYWEEMNKSLAIYPMEKLKYNQTYTITVGTGINNEAGLGLASAYSFSFKTETGPLPPTVVSSVPANGASGVSNSATIMVNFSQFMNQDVTDPVVSISPVIANSWTEWWGPALMINHNGLTANTTYSISIGASAESEMGVAMGSAYSFSFTTSSSTVDRPIVMFTNPFPGQTDVEAYMPIDLSFNKPMNTASVEGALSISPTVTGNLAWFGTTDLSFYGILKEGTTYTVTIADTAKDLSGVTMEPYTLSFTTMGAAQAKAPKVLATIPRNTAFDIPLKTKIIVNFTEEMNKTASEGAFSILPATAGSFSWLDTMTMAFVPSEALKSTTKYSVTVKNTATSTAGATLEASYAWSFTTGALTGRPQVLTVLPTPGFTNVPRSSTINAVFNLPMNPFDTEAAFSIEPAVAGTSSWVNENTLMFKPTDLLEPGKIFKVKVAATAAAVNGATMEADYSWTFITGYGDGISPVVVYSSPYVDETGVPVDTNVVLTFSHAMDPEATQKAITVLPPVQGSFTWLSDRQIQFDPTSDLSKDSTYWIIVSTGAKSTSGIAISSMYTYGFTTVGAVVASGPSITATSPEEGAVDVARDTQVSFTFNTSMDANMTESQLVVEPPVDGVVKWSETTAGSVMTFVPSAEGYPSGATMFFRVMGYSATGEPMDSAFVLTFDTKVEDISMPFITYTSPYDGTDMVPLDSQIMIGFSEPMDTAAAAGKMVINYIDPVQSETAGYPVEVAAPTFVSWSADGFTATLALGDGTAPVALTAGRTYTVSVDGTMVDLSGNTLPEDYFFTFTAAIDTATIVPGQKRWDVTLAGDLSHSCMGSFGGVYISSADGKLHAVNPDGSIKWNYTPAGVTATAVSSPSVIKEDGVIIYSVNDTIYAFGADGKVKHTLTSVTGEAVMGPVAIDSRKSVVFARNTATAGTVVSLIPETTTVLWTHALTEKVAFPVVVNRNGNFVVITESGKVHEISPNGLGLYAQPYDLGAAATAAPAIGDHIYLTVGSKLVAISNNTKAWEAEIAPTGQNLTSPVIANGTIFVGSSTADGTQGGFYAVSASTGSLVDTYADANHALDAGVTIPAMAMGDVTYFAAGKKLYALSGSATTFTVDWVFNLDEQFTTATNIIGMGYNKAGHLFVATQGGRLVSVFGTMAPDLSKLTWPKYMGNRFNTGSGINNLDGAIKGALAEAVPFQAKLGAETEFTAYASVTYASSDVPDVTMALLGADTTTAATVLDDNALVDTVQVLMPPYFTNLSMVRVQNLLGDVLGATIEADTARNALIAKLHNPIYDSPAVLFRGVKVTFKATAPASMPTDTDNKVKIFLGSSKTGNFVAASEGDGDAGGQVVRNSLKVELVADGSEAGATITEAYCEVQPKSIAANAGGKDSTGKVQALERYSMFVRVPQTSKINPKGVNVIAMTVPKGMVVSGVAVSKNGSILTRNTDYKVRYTNGDPIYIISLTNSIRQVDLVSKAMTLKVEFTVSTPNTTWMSVVNCALSYINDLDKFFGATTTTPVLIALEPYACQPGNADGTAMNGDDNLLVVKPKNAAPSCKDLSPAADVDASGVYVINWKSKDVDSLVEYRLFYSTKSDIDLVTAISTDATLITGRYPVFDGRMLSEYSTTESMQYIWNLAEKNLAGEYVVPEGRYYIHAIADDGVNPPVQLKSLGRITVKRATNNTAPAFAFVGLEAGAVTADASATIDFTAADADSDPVTVELYFYPAKDNVRAYACFDAAGAVLKTTSGTSPLTWYTADVADGKYYVMAWYTDYKHTPVTVWSTNTVDITHTPVTANEPPSFEWTNPDPTKPMPSVQKSIDLAWKGSDADDSATATVSLYYNKTQAEDTDLTLIAKDIKLSTNTYKWDTSTMKNGFYYLLAKVKENKAGTVTPTLRFWSDIPVFIDLAAIGGLGQVKVSALTSTTADIYFRSTVPTTGKVKYGINGVTNLTGTDSQGVVRNHKVSLTGLSPSTTYYYLVEATGDGATYVLDNGGELFSFKTLAQTQTSSTSHFIGGSTGVPNAFVTIYIDSTGAATKDAGSLAAPSLSQPIVVQTDSSGNWSANVANALDSSGNLVALSSTSKAKVEVLSEDGKSATTAVDISNVGSHTTSSSAVAATVSTLSSSLTHTINLYRGFNLVALPLTPSTTLTAKQFLVKAGENAKALYYFDVSQGKYKTIFRLSNGTNLDTDFYGTDFDLDLTNGFFVKMAADGSVNLEGTKLSKPKALALLRGFNMLTISYGKDFPFSTKTGTTAMGFLKKAGNDAKAIYSFEDGLYKTIFRIKDGDADSSFYAPSGDFDLLSGKSYFFKMNNTAAVTPTAD